MEFEKFKKENAYWLDKDSLYEALTIENGNDYWPSWSNDTDKRLMNPKSHEEQMLFGQRMEEIENKPNDEDNNKP